MKQAMAALALWLMAMPLLAAEQDSLYEQPASDSIPGLKDQPEPQQDFDEPNPLSLQAGLGLGGNYVAADLTVLYAFTPYTAWQISGMFQSERDGDRKSTVYGSTAGLRLIGRNPTILTPFVGVGLGYQGWKRVASGALIDNSGSPIAVSFAGLNLALTAHFAVELTRTVSHYLASPPRSWDANGQRESKTFADTAIGFQLSL